MDSLHHAKAEVTRPKLKVVLSVFIFEVEIQTEESLVDVGGGETASYFHGEVFSKLLDQDAIDLAFIVDFALHDHPWLLTFDVPDELGGECVSGLGLHGHHHGVHHVGLFLRAGVGNGEGVGEAEVFGKREA